MLPNGHFHNDWQRFVKTWFNQPARKTKRRAARQEKAKLAGSRPTAPLQPIVQAQTIRYCHKTKTGRGFSLEELKKAGLTPLFARSIGIKVDHRRKNRSQETLMRNAQALELYKSKISLVARKPGKPVKGQIDDAK